MADVAFNKKGQPCKMCLRVGRPKCLTHGPNIDLHKRNRTVALHAQENDPAGYYRKSRKGFDRCVAIHGLLPVMDGGRKRRLREPSLPEQAAIAVCDGLNLDYEREVYTLPPSYSTSDIVAYGVDNRQFSKPLVIEIAGHQFKECFGEPVSRWDKLMKKVREIAKYGNHVIVLDAREQDQWQAQVEESVRFLS